MAVVLTRQSARGGAQAGFTLIEALAAAVLLGVVALAVVPVFLHASVANVSGSRSTQAANFARARAEAFLQLPFDAEPLQILDGTERVYEEHFSPLTESWVPGAAPTGTDVEWERTTTVRQFSVTDLVNPRQATDPPGSIHLKEIVVTIEGRSFQTAAKSITVRRFKSQ